MDSKVERVGIVVLPRVGRVFLLRILPKRRHILPCVGCVALLLKIMLVAKVGTVVAMKVESKL